MDLHSRNHSCRPTGAGGRARGAPRRQAAGPRGGPRLRRHLLPGGKEGAINLRRARPGLRRDRVGRSHEEMLRISSASTIVAELLDNQLHTGSSATHDEVDPQDRQESETPSRPLVAHGASFRSRCCTASIGAISASSRTRKVLVAERILRGEHFLDRAAPGSLADSASLVFRSEDAPTAEICAIASQWRHILTRRSSVTGRRFVKRIWVLSGAIDMRNHVLAKAERRDPTWHRC
jgi:hypothetical protein